jgi:hypothetical protein
MIEGQEVMEELIHLLSVESQPTKAHLAQTSTSVFLIRSASDTIYAFFTMPLFFPKLPVDHLENCHGPK